MLAWFRVGDPIPEHSVLIKSAMRATRYMIGDKTTTPLEEEMWLYEVPYKLPKEEPELYEAAEAHVKRSVVDLYLNVKNGNISALSDGLYWAFVEGMRTERKRSGAFQHGQNADQQSKHS